MILTAGVAGLPEVRAGDDVAAMVAEAIAAGWCELGPLADGDVVVFTSKIVSKAEGRLVRLDGIEPSALAREWAAAWGKDPRHVEVVLGESRRIVRMDHGVLIAETRHGLICANAGVDASNAPEGSVLVLLPLDPDGSARALRDRLRVLTGADVAVVLSDTFGRPWRTGQTNIAIGAAGISALRRYAGATDPAGYELRATEIALADELAGAAEMVMGKLDRVPVAAIRGVEFQRPVADEPDRGAAALIRAAETDMFR